MCVDGCEYIRVAWGWLLPTPNCETNCETSTPVDSESVAPKMAELLQFYW